MEYERTPKVSVIAPIYGVEQFIGKAAKSMMEQTLHDVEFIFVDDCTQDKSIEVLCEVISHYPNRSGQVSIIKHNTNKGLPAARNTGLEVARGEYIFHWDSDDYAEKDMLEYLYNEAKRNCNDYVWCDWFLTFNSNSRIMRQPTAATPREALSIVLAGCMKYNVWNKLVARSLYTDSKIRFPEGYSMGEDMTMIKLLTQAKSVGHVAKPLYHYIRTNSSAMTQIYSDAHLKQLLKNTTDVCYFLRNQIIDNSIEREISWFKLNVKLPFLFSGRQADMVLWKKWFPESNRDIKSNHIQALRTRILQWTAAHNLSLVNRAYNILVYKFIYGILYK